VYAEELVPTEERRHGPGVRAPGHVGGGEGVRNSPTPTQGKGGLVKGTNGNRNEDEVLF